MALNTAVDASAVARVVGIETNFKDLRGGAVKFLPQRLAVVGQGNTAATYSTDKSQVTSAKDVGDTYGYGSPLYLAARKLFPTNGDGVGTIPVTLYPLQDDGSGVASTGDITPSGTATEDTAFKVVINEIESEEFVVETTDSVSDITAKITTAINAILAMPVDAVDSTTKVDLTSKWKGESANDIFIEVDGPTDKGVTFAFSQPSGGLVNPDVQTAIDQVGDVWETMILNCMNIDDTTTLDKFETFGDGRWGSLTHKPLVVYSGNNKKTVSNITAESDSRKSDRVNALLSAPGSNELPWVIAARELVPILRTANNNPPRDYGSQEVTQLEPGLDGDQLDYAARDSAVKKGASTITVRDGVIHLADTVTFYHPDGEAVPPYRYVVDIVKIQNILFNINLEFNSDEWDGAPLVPDGQFTVNPAAKSPSAAVSAMHAIIDSLAENAIISDPDFAKDNTSAEIDSQNPKRLNINTRMKIAGNANIISIGFDFGFFFGGVAA